MEKPLFGEPRGMDYIFVGNFTGNSFYLLLGKFPNGVRNDYIHRHDKPGKWLSGVLPISRFDINKMSFPITARQLYDMEVRNFGMGNFEEKHWVRLVREMTDHHSEYKKAFDVAIKYLMLT